MATFKQATKKTTRSKRTAAKPGVQDQAERLSKTLSESAQQIWLAGVGAFGRAQAEGTKLFEALVKEGLTLEQSTRKLASGRADVVRDALEQRVGQARERAADTWGRLEKVFENRVQRALVDLDVPGRDDLSELSRRVEDLTAELRRHNSGAPKKRSVSGATKATGTRAAKPVAGRARKTAK